MSIKGVCIPSGGDYVKASSYINIKGEYPTIPTVVRWNNLVFNKEELNDNNWLYIGNDSNDGKKNKIMFLNIHEGFMWIIDS